MRNIGFRSNSKLDDELSLFVQLWAAKYNLSYRLMLWCVATIDVYITELRTAEFCFLLIPLFSCCFIFL